MELVEGLKYLGAGLAVIGVIGAGMVLAMFLLLLLLLLEEIQLQETKFLP